MAFQSTRPVRGATPTRCVWSLFSLNFNPRAPCGARRGRGRLPDPDGDFNPRAPCGARPEKMKGVYIMEKFQSTRPVRGATVSFDLPAFSPSNFNPRAPCGARHTPTIRQATARYFNPRAPCGARPGHGDAFERRRGDFNPRAPCGARLILVLLLFWRLKFQSTRPVRGATFSPSTITVIIDISIHAPRAGRDNRQSDRRHG